jgi:outer membrane protein OmpA-like peptidoglycan-associated protein
MNMKLKYLLRKSTLALALSTTVFTVGCAGTPKTPPTALEQARGAYQSALANPQVPRLAPTELNRAGRALAEAERLWLAGEDVEEVAHRAYLAQQQTRIASEAALARAARNQIAQADLQRERVVAEARQAEALAQQRAAERERAAALQRAEQAQQQALLEQQRSAEIQTQAKQQIGQLEAELQKLQAQQTDRGWVVSISGDVLFDVGQATLKPGAYHSLNQLAYFMRENARQNVVVEGYTDATGSEELNLALSQRRAEAVKQALIAQGIAPDRIMTRAYGEAFPVASNATVAGRQLNRRVEFVIPRTDVAGLSR